MSACPVSIPQRLDAAGKRLELRALLRPKRVWDYSDTIGAARASCTWCGGLGRTDGGNVCNCVLREAFRACRAKYRWIRNTPRCAGVTLEHLPRGLHGGPRFYYSRADEEFAAAFGIAGMRALGGDERLRGVFRLHVLEEREWTGCVKRLRIDRGSFWHYVYRVQELAGRSYRDEGLYPLSAYFGKRETGFVLAVQARRQRGE